MADDFRIVGEVHDEGHGRLFGRLLGERGIVHDVRGQLGDGVLVTRDGPHVFLYTGTRKQAEVAAKVVRDVLAQDEMKASVSPVERWHPAEERWEDAAESLPQTEEQVEAEHERWEEEQ